MCVCVCVCVCVCIRRAVNQRFSTQNAHVKKKMEAVTWLNGNSDRFEIIYPDTHVSLAVESRFYRSCDNKIFLYS